MITFALLVLSFLLFLPLHFTYPWYCQKTSVVVGTRRSFFSGNQRVIGSHAKREFVIGHRRLRRPTRTNNNRCFFAISFGLLCQPIRGRVRKKRSFAICTIRVKGRILQMLSSFYVPSETKQEGNAFCFPLTWVASLASKNIPWNQRSTQWCGIIEYRIFT